MHLSCWARSGLLGIIAGGIADGLIGKEAFKFPKILDPIVKPVSSAFIKVTESATTYSY